LKTTHDSKLTELAKLIFLLASLGRFAGRNKLENIVARKRCKAQTLTAYCHTLDDMNNGRKSAIRQDGRQYWFQFLLSAEHKKKTAYEYHCIIHAPNYRISFVCSIYQTLGVKTRFRKDMISLSSNVLQVHGTRVH
jgi:hypothetical protein